MLCKKPRSSFHKSSIRIFQLNFVELGKHNDVVHNVFKIYLLLITTFSTELISISFCFAVDLFSFQLLEAFLLELLLVAPILLIAAE